MVAPALQNYKEKVLLGDVWRRPGLGARDRSIVTLAALITRQQTAEMADYVALSLDHGVKPTEVSEIITHLAFYAGWGNAVAAAGAARDVFATRGIAADQLSPVSPALLPLNEAAEADRAKRRPNEPSSHWMPRSARLGRAVTNLSAAQAGRRGLGAVRGNRR